MATTSSGMAAATNSGTATKNSGKAVVTLPSDTQILITREFEAPRDLVFRVWTTPEFIRRWWPGGRGRSTGVEVDLRAGGTWRRGIVTDAGVEAAFHGEYREVVPNERIVATEVFDSRPDAEALTTTTFTEFGGRTVVEQLIEYGSREDRDAHLGYGLEGGLQEAMDLVEQLTLSLR